MVARQRNRPMSHTPSPESVRIVQFPETRVAVMTHRGDPARIGETIRRFIDWRKAHGLPPRTHATFNILHGAPDQGAPGDFRLDLCVATDRAVTEDGSGVVAGLLAGGRCAVLRHVGPDDALGAAFACLYGQWLPDSGEELRGDPPFLQRVAFFPDVPEHEAVVDIFLPLRPSNQPQV
ncbi:DNA gyrase inhibitor [Paramagnetospirillum magneticum AMB-1]|uniref:DNA gyrase inhibitor n=2 Tax=Paramagnetospirillum magneticum TaxID=84159 RepID=Q2W3L3_PARM1|nr:DNA gyrase inhibitor [Paramagnetospirillum magneticum AMB-1]